MSELLLALALICQERNTHYGDVVNSQKHCVAKLLKCIGNPKDKNASDKLILCLETK